MSDDCPHYTTQEERGKRYGFIRVGVPCLARPFINVQRIRRMNKHAVALWVGVGVMALQAALEIILLANLYVRLGTPMEIPASMAVVVVFPLGLLLKWFSLHLVYLHWAIWLLCVSHYHDHLWPSLLVPVRISTYAAPHVANVYLLLKAGVATAVLFLLDRKPVVSPLSLPVIY
ncbi:uncharacterized protein LOC135093342 [Scylla paramamosain]|uniref:uncharacterized protein LOC135093342 n=1 Tax=Scylla paramamosain TaxID=85552 RepID=UPI0030834A44